MLPAPRHLPLRLPRLQMPRPWRTVPQRPARYFVVASVSELFSSSCIESEHGRCHRRFRHRMRNHNLMALVSSIVSGNTAKVLEIIDASPDLVQQPSLAGASREEATEYFFPEIRHYLYAGDTALHM